MMVQIFSILLIIFTLLSLLTNIFLLKTHKQFLYLLIPLQLFIASFSFLTFESVKGYATRNVSELKQEFTYISHFSNNENVYIIGLAENSSEPRMYVITSQNEKQLEKLQKIVTKLGTIQQKVEQGNIVKITLSETDDITWKIDYKIQTIKKD